MTAPLASAPGTPAPASATASATPAASAAPAPLPRPAPANFDAVLTRGAFMPLSQFGVIDATGDDAATFLHSQLTNDTQHLDAASARLAGYCSAKGRLLASFLTCRSGESLPLLLSQHSQAAA